MNNIKKALVLIIYFSISFNSQANSCLDKLLPAFKANNVYIERYAGSRDLYLSSGDIANTNDLNLIKCDFSPKELDLFTRHNFLKISKIDPSVVQSWNYLAINKIMIYDYQTGIKTRGNIYPFDPAENYYNEDPMEMFFFRASISYSLISVINDKYACYKEKFRYFDANHNLSTNERRRCSSSIATDAKITDFVYENDLVAGITNNKSIHNTLKQLGVKPGSITTLKQLQSILSKDTDMNCILGQSKASNIPTTPFLITKLNYDGTINIIYDISEMAQSKCRATAPKAINLINLKPKIKIDKFILGYAL